MKLQSLVTLTCLAAILALGGVGCKKKPVGTTQLPYGGTTTQPQRPLPQPPIGGNPLLPGDGVSVIGDEGFNTGIPQSGNRDINDPRRARNTTQFESETVHFDFDRYIVKSEEMGKIQTVASFIRANPSHDILVEGHCDVRGTEGYNLALGDRRALAVREALIAAGAPADNIHTVSYGESRPADPGNSNAAHARNRRGVFVLVLPAQ